MRTDRSVLCDDFHELLTLFLLHSIAEKLYIFLKNWKERKNFLKKLSKTLFLSQKPRNHGEKWEKTLNYIKKENRGENSFLEILWEKCKNSKKLKRKPNAPFILFFLNINPCSVKHIQAISIIHTNDETSYSCVSFCGAEGEYPGNTPFKLAAHFSYDFFR